MNSMFNSLVWQNLIQAVKDQCLNTERSFIQGKNPLPSWVVYTQVQAVKNSSSDYIHLSDDDLILMLPPEIREFNQEKTQKKVNGYPNEATYLLSLYLENDIKIWKFLYELQKDLPNKSKGFYLRHLLRLTSVIRELKSIENANTIHFDFIYEHFLEMVVNQDFSGYTNLETEKPKIEENIIVNIDFYNDIAILEFLKKGEIKNNIYYLPKLQLSKETYNEIKSLLNDVYFLNWKGGKVQGFEAKHLIDIQRLMKDITNPQPIVKPKKDWNFFSTNQKRANEMIQNLTLLGLNENSRVLEPSGGEGVLCQAICNIVKPENLTIVEFFDRNASILSKKYPNVIEKDFLETTPEELGQFDFIVMNPPFSKNRDVKHVLHALTFLKENGYSSVIVGSTATESEEFTQLASFAKEPNDWNLTDIPNGEFKEAGTAVGAKQIVISEQLFQRYKNSFDNELNMGVF